MQKKNRRPVYYSALSMNDGSVLQARPMRKGHGMEVRDEDNICLEFPHGYAEAFANTIRSFDILANRLNVRRSLRELVLPELEAISQQIAELQAAVYRIEKRLGS